MGAGRQQTQWGITSQALALPEKFARTLTSIEELFQEIFDLHIAEERDRLAERDEELRELELDRMAEVAL